MDQSKTPLFNALLEYVNNKTISFHVPGHKKGHGMDPSFLDFVGSNVLSMDVTVFKQVDSLHLPIGPIKQAQELAAKAYHADRTFFSVHGTSGAIQAMIMSVVKSGEKIIVPRNIHKSVTAGIILSGATPVYMQPEIDADIGVALNVTPETVKVTLEKHPDSKAVLIVNPTYYGVSADLTAIVNLVHEYKIPLIVDEAHGPHFQFCDRLPISAMDAGADLCAQSTHKLTGSMHQSSMLHVKEGLVSADKVRALMSLLQTTSPSYILLASLDVARMQMSMKGKELLGQTIHLAKYAREQINSIDGLSCFGYDVLKKKGAYGFDPTKITISSIDMGISGYQLERILAEEYCIQPELADLYNVLCIISIGDTKESVDHLLKALKEISNKKSKKSATRFTIKEIPLIPNTILNPREAFNSKSNPVKLAESIGQISAEFLMAYPPGIPILVPGEIITHEIIDYVTLLKANNLSVQGTDDPEVKQIKVIDGGAAI